MMTHVPAPKGGAVLDCAAREAAGNRAGAGDMFTRIDERIEMALVLEPDVSRETAYQMLPVAQVAAGEAIAALAPPETEVTHRWGGALVVNGADVGTVRGRCAANDRNGSPEWLAVGIRLDCAPRERDPGRDPGRSTLVDELGPLDATEIVEAIARHWMAWLHDWESAGWPGVARAWDGRAVPGQGVRLPGGGDGALLGLDEGGNAIVRGADGATLAPLASLWDGPA